MIKNKNRLVQYELIRIISMFMIVLHHICVHGSFGIKATEFQSKIFIVQTFSIYGKVGVALFMMITGYFLVNSQVKIKKVFRIISQTIFYLTLGFIILLINLWKNDYLSFSTIEDSFLSSYFPFTGYWFMNGYILLFLLLPIINPYIVKLSRTQFLKVIGLGIILFSFSGIITGNFAPLGDAGTLFLPYLLGAFLSRFPYPISNSKSLSLFIFTSCFAIFLTRVLDFLGPRRFLVTFISNALFFARDNGILVLIMAVSLFLTLQNLSITNPKLQHIINILGNAMLGVYLFHDNRVVRPEVSNFFSSYWQLDSLMFPLQLIGAAFLVFFVSIAIELIRQLLFQTVHLILYKFNIAKHTV